MAEGTNLKNVKITIIFEISDPKFLTLYLLNIRAQLI